MKKKYTVLVRFKWRGKWLAVGEPLSLLDCEAGTLVRAGKIEEVPVEDKSKENPKKGSK